MKTRKQTGRDPPPARGRPGRRRRGHGHAEGLRGLEYGIPRLHSPVNSRRFLEIFGYFCKKKQASVSFRGKLFAPVDFRRKPEPLLRTQVFSQGPHPRARGQRDHLRLRGRVHRQPPHHLHGAALGGSSHRTACYSMI